MSPRSSSRRTQVLSLSLSLSRARARVCVDGFARRTQGSRAGAPRRPASRWTLQVRISDCAHSNLHTNLKSGPCSIGAERRADDAGLFSLARLRLKDAGKQAPTRRAGSTAGGGYVYWQAHQWIALASHHRLHSSCCRPCRCRCPCASRTNSMAWVLSAPNRAVSAPHHGTVVQRDAIHASR